MATPSATPSSLRHETAAFRDGVCRSATPTTRASFPRHAGTATHQLLLGLCTHAWCTHPWVWRESYRSVALTLTRLMLRRCSMPMHPVPITPMRTCCAAASAPTKSSACAIRLKCLFIFGANVSVPVTTTACDYHYHQIASRNACQWAAGRMMMTSVLPPSRCSSAVYSSLFLIIIYYIKINRFS